MFFQRDRRALTGWWLVLMLAVLLACALPAKTSSNDNPAGEVSPQPERPAAATPMAGSTLAPPAESNPAAWRFPGEDAEAVRTFRSRMRYTVALPDVGKQYTLMEMRAEVISGQAEHAIIMQQEGKAQVEIVQIGNQAWMRSGDGPWLMVTSDQIARVLSSSDDFLQRWGNAEDWQYAGAEQVDGKAVYHYTLDFSAALPQVNADDWFYSAESSVPVLQGASFAAKTAQADAYVFKDGTLFKIFYVIGGEAKLADGSTQAVEMHSAYEIADINADIQITPPAEAASLTEAPFPLPENAVAAGGMPGVQMFTVPDTAVADVLAFLETHLPGAGFTVSSKMGSAANGYMLTVEGNGATYAVTISPAGADVAISIMGGG